MSIRDIFNKEIINHYKQNKDLITEELLSTLRAFGNEGKQVALDILDTETDNEKYYLDAFGNRISFDGNRQIKKAYTKMNISKIHEIEIQKCMDDIFYFMDNYIKLTTPKGVNFPDLRPYQRDFINILIDPKNENIISLQPRQASKSTTIAIVLVHDVLFDKDLVVGIAANKLSMSREFIDKIRKIYTNIPMWMQPGMNTWNKSSLETEHGVRILSDTSTEGAFRGFSCHKIITDEAAFCNNFDAYMDSVQPAQSGLSRKQNIIISTANGQNHFYDLWKDAGETLEDSKNTYIRYFVNWQDVPRFKTDGTLYEPEEFKRDIIKKSGSVFWAQNYACEFLGSSNTLIKGEVLANFEVLDPEFVRNPGLKIYKEPEEKHHYIFGIDSAKDGTDNFAIQVLDITNFEFRQVASAKLQIDYLRMPEFIDEWGRYYNNAFLIIENNEGAGQSIADRLHQEFEYPNMYFDKTRPNKGIQKRKKYPGFRTTRTTRDIILQTMKTIAESGKLEIHDKDTIKELFSFILINDKYQADNGKKDDLVMSLALCFGAFVESKNFNDMREVVKLLDQNDKESDVEISDYLVIGDFDSYSDDNLDEKDFNHEKYWT